MHKLIQECDRLVKDYGGLAKVPMTDEVNAFPGASGFLDGEPGRRRVLILLHNYAGTSNISRKENHESAFWLTLDFYLKGAGLDRRDVFLTNLYMGLRNGSAVGEMVGGGPNFANECFAFFERQCDIVDPDLVVICGDEVKKALLGWSGRPSVYVAHPSSNRDANHRERRATKWAREIREALAKASLRQRGRVAINSDEGQR